MTYSCNLSGSYRAEPFSDYQVSIYPEGGRVKVRIKGQNFFFDPAGEMPEILRGHGYGGALVRRTEYDFNKDWQEACARAQAGASHEP